MIKCVAGCNKLGAGHVSILSRNTRMGEPSPRLNLLVIADSEPVTVECERSKRHLSAREEHVNLVYTSYLGASCTNSVSRSTRNVSDSVMRSLFGSSYYCSMAIAYSHRQVSDKTHRARSSGEAKRKASPKLVKRWYLCACKDRRPDDLSMRLVSLLHKCADT